MPLSSNGRLARLLSCLALAALLPLCRAALGAESGKDVDAVTAASVDAETGASKRLEPVAISDRFSVAYAINDDGALFITAGDLINAYQQDELASDALFKDRIVQVKGEVEKTSKPDAAKPWLTLIGDGTPGEKVRCSLRTGQPAGKSILPGAVVQIRGSCGGMKLSVSILEGEIIE